MTAIAHGLYDGKPTPQSWERSLYHHQLVFVRAFDTHARVECNTCAMRIGTGEPGCAHHPCSGGAWFTEQEAAIMRLESS